MSDIILTTLTAGYAHSSFGLRCLLANLGELAPRAKILEFDAGMRTPEIAEALLSLEPKIVGIGVYIWNVAECTMLAAELKKLRPALTIVLGGPEVSHMAAEQDIFCDADFVIAGEGDLAFAQLCRLLLSGSAAGGKMIAAAAPDPASLALPYHLYTDEDVSRRIIYAEASRGCPFACDFCLSAVGGLVRVFPLERLFAAWQKLLDRGARRFKFVDRTFNLDISRARAILKFFLNNSGDGLFLHFEVVPDRFPKELCDLLRKFPPGSLQLEVGVQTLDKTVAARVNRRQDNAAVERNLRLLRHETDAHIHADLVIGLPGEGLEGFAAGFDRLTVLDPHEIQAVTLKKLRGAPIARHDEEWGMVYSPYPPYELRQNKLLDFFTLQRLRRFARYWDLVSNSGVFGETAKLLREGPSAFHSFLAFSDWLYARTHSTHSISRARLRELMRTYLTEALHCPPEKADSALERDALKSSRTAKSRIPPRQALHHSR